MSNILISYDLNRSKDYTALYQELNRLAAEKVMDSVYIIKNTSYTSSAYFDSINQFLDNDDSLIVTNIHTAWFKNTGISASRNIKEVIA